MSDSPPRRIGEKKDYPLHAPPQRHHPDPAASRSQIRPLPTGPAMPNAAPNAGDLPNQAQTVSDHAGAVADAMKAHTDGQLPHLTSGKGA